MKVTEIENYDRQLDRLQNRYGLSFQSAMDILECVAAFTKYDSIPQATRDSLQAICDVFNVSLIFNQKKRKNRVAHIVLTGIFEPLGVSFLYHDAQKVSKWCKNTSEWHLHPNADNKLERVEE